jgi:hypothetical protein
MTTVTELFAVAAVLAGLLTSIAVWAPRRPAVKLAALGAAWLFLPVAYAGLVELLSKPKPVGLEWWQRHAEAATVLGSRIAEDDGIYLWLQLAEVNEPRAYVLPWDRKLAEQLQAAQREADQNQTQLVMRLPFDPSLEDREPRFYAPPQAAAPPKEVPPAGEMHRAPAREARR